MRLQKLSGVRHGHGLQGPDAAVMALDSYPVGPVDAARVQRVADVMRQFLGFPVFNMTTMISG